MAESTSFELNGNTVTASADPDTPLLYVLTDQLPLPGPRSGCGPAQCCSRSAFHIARHLPSSATPLSAVAGSSITTLEGLPALYADAMQLDQVPEFTPLQEAVIEEQAIQCGYCYNGMLIKATELLNNNPTPSESEIRSAMNGHLCRCGTYPKLLSAIQKAARKMGEDA